MAHMRGFFGTAVLSSLAAYRREGSGLELSVRVSSLRRLHALGVDGLSCSIVSLSKHFRGLVPEGFNKDARNSEILEMTGS